jgi:putative two-component system response regulator
VADVFDSLTSNRPFRCAWLKEEAMNYIQDMAGKQFDPKIVTLFLSMHDQIQ